ncbi:MAG: transcriptional regulator, LuxR family, partial [Solirubrobacterales bacterium]|nr:transcriptional regulator, LuxR family [Solirubrobacterales bacterium]
AAGDPRAVPTFERVLAGLASGDAHAGVLHELGRAHVYAGDFARALDAFTLALEETADSDDDLQAEVLASMALMAVVAEPRVREAAIAEIEPQLARPREVRHEGERVMLAAVATYRAIHRLDGPGALALARRAWGGGMLGLSESPEVLVNMLASVFVLADQHAVGLQIMDRALLTAIEAGNAPLFAITSYSRAQCLARMGVIDDALADLERARDVGRHAWFRPAADALYARVALERDETEPAEALLADAHVSAPQTDEPWAAGLAGDLRGECALILGRLDVARAHLTESRRIHEHVIDVHNPARSAWRSNLAEVLHAMGDTDDALALLAAEERLARTWGAPSVIGRTLATRGAVEGGDAGIASLQSAVQLLGGSPARLRHAQAQLDLGRLLESVRGDGAGREQLRLALDLADECGSHRVARMARDALVAAGGRPRRARLTGPASLTPSERRVAELAAAGQTNREIATGLFVTVKAVRWHLANTYRKLGVESREELGAAL